MSDTFYVLMAIGYSYDDQNYSRYEGGGGQPDKVFTSKKKAEAAALQKNVDSFKGIFPTEVRDYGYDLSEILSKDVVEDELEFEEGIFMTLLGMPASKWWETGYDSGKLKVVPTDEQWVRLYNCFNVSFYEVVTVQKG